MNCYTFSREMEYTATAYLKQKAYGDTPEEAYAKLQESMWEFDDEPSLDEEAGEQIGPDEIVQVNKKYVWDGRVEQDSACEEADRWNQNHREKVLDTNEPVE